MSAREPEKLEICMSDTAPWKENTEPKKTRELREQRELHERRNQQQLDAQKALETLKEHLRNTTSTRVERDVLSSPVFS